MSVTIQEKMQHLQVLLNVCRRYCNLDHVNYMITIADRFYAQGLKSECAEQIDRCIAEVKAMIQDRFKLAEERE